MEDNKMKLPLIVSIAVVMVLVTAVLPAIQFGVQGGNNWNVLAASDYLNTRGYTVWATGGLAPGGIPISQVDGTLATDTGLTYNSTTDTLTTTNISAPTVNINQGSLNFIQVSPPTVAPNVAINASAGNLNGTYYYAVTFYTSLGETNYDGIRTLSVSPINQQVDLTNIPISVDSGVIGRKIYRTPAGGDMNTSFQYVATINNNIATTYTDNLADGGLGALLPNINTTGGQIFVNGTRLLAYSTNRYSLGFGLNTLSSNTGWANVAFGEYSLNAVTTGNRNVAIGSLSMEFTTTGYQNAAVGIHALQMNTTGYYNTAIGMAALGLNTGGHDNVAGGTSALYSNLTGNYNTAYGSFSLFNNTGSQNNAFGFESLYNATGGSNNAFGYQALKANTTAVANSAFGDRALPVHQTGNNNAAFGSNALGSNVSGGTNIAMGTATLFSNVTGSANVAIGYAAGFYETGSNKLFIDNNSRASEADGRVKSLIYGVFDASVINQQVTVNGSFNTATADGTSSNIGVSTNFKRFYKEITLDTADAETAVGLTPNAVIISAAIRVSTQVDGLDAADHHIQLGINGTPTKYIDVAEGAANAYISVNKKGHYTFDPTTDTETNALVLTITGGADQTPTAGKCYVEVIYLDSTDLPNP